MTSDPYDLSEEYFANPQVRISNAPLAVPMCRLRYYAPACDQNPSNPIKTKKTNNNKRS